MNKLFSVVKSFFLRYRTIIIGCAIGFFAGWWGVIVGFFIALLFNGIQMRYNEQKALRSYFRNPTGKSITEPFAGAAITCAIAVLCCKDKLFVERQTKIYFASIDFDGWHSFCIAASKESVELDILTEILASKLRHVTDVAIIESVFKFLQAVEFGWNNKLMGDRPTIYLSHLLNYSFYADDYLTACTILGVDKNDSFKAIKERYRTLVVAYHPDKSEHLSADEKENASDMFLRIQKAFQIISERYKS